MEKLEEVLKRDSSSKVVIFCHFLEMMNLLELDMGLNGIFFTGMRGSMSQTERKNKINSFKNDKRVRVFIASISTGGVGLNLTVANTVFIIEPWWNIAVELQAIDRVHRIGQTKPVEVVRFICENTIEERVLEIQNQKKQLINMTITSSKEDKKIANIEMYKKIFDL